MKIDLPWLTWVKLITILNEGLIHMMMKGRRYHKTSIAQYEDAVLTLKQEVDEAKAWIDANKR